MHGQTVKGDIPAAYLDDLVVKYTTTVPMDDLGHNIKLALQRDLPRFFGSTLIERDGGWQMQWADHPIAIVAGGPTLRKTIDRVRGFKTVMVAGSAHDYLVSQRIVPDYCVLLDGIAEAVDWLQNPQQATTYLLASQNHPAMFEHLRDYEVQLWHAMGIDGIPDHEPSVGGGPTTVLRCLELAFLMGFWDQHFFGLDSCYLDDGTTHAYDDWSPPKQMDLTVESRKGSRTFKTDLGMIGQAEVFIATMNERKHLMRATVHGDNLISETVADDNGNKGIHVAC